MGSGFGVAIDATASALSHSRPLRTWLRSSRWCGDGIGLSTRLRVQDRALLEESGSEALVLFLLQAKDSDGRSRAVSLPLSIAMTQFDESAFELNVDGSTLYLSEAEQRDAYARVVVEGFREGARIRTASGDVVTFRGENLGAVRDVVSLSESDTSNVLVRLVTTRGDHVLKSYRFLDSSNREPDILGRLRDRAFPHAARLTGEIALGRGKDRLVLAIGTEQIDGTDLFSFLRDGLRREPLLEGRRDGDFASESQAIASDLGRATAMLHEALHSRGRGPWASERFTREDFQDAFRDGTGSLGSALRRLGRLVRATDPGLADAARATRTQLLDLRSAIEATLRGLERNVGGIKAVTHADLHLAQVLRRRSDGRLFFIDFEGEPERSADQRSRKQPPLRDVGSMVRSFAYVRHYAMRGSGGETDDPGSPSVPDSPAVPEHDTSGELLAWEVSMVDRFLREYLTASGIHRGMERPEAMRLIRAWAMVKALYELDYELAHRVQNFPIPLAGIVDLAATG